MSAEEPRESPPENAGSPFAADAETVASAVPQSPRLGIIHLFGWTTCIAIYAALRWLLSENVPEDVSQSFWIFVGLLAVVQGTALGGLVIWVARRMRGLRFPIYPGEVLFVLLGFEVVCWLPAELLPMFNEIAAPFTLRWTVSGFQPHLLLLSAFFASLYFLAGRRFRIDRWRIFFYVEAGSRAMIILQPFLGALLWYTSHQVLDIVAATLMVVIVVIDRRERLPYTWTHWLGAALVISSAAIMLALHWWQAVYGPTFG